MIGAEEELARLLRESGAVLVRKNRHLVYRLPNGQMYTMAATPSDFRAADNQLRQLRKVLGMKRETRKNPGRTAKKGAPGAPKFMATTRPTEKPNPFAGMVFRVREVKYKGCYPVDVRHVPMTPLWCLLRNLVGYGGETC